ncbi:MAG: hypothetical protein SNG35_07245 [Rikenellaceae bacterium]
MVSNLSLRSTLLFIFLTLSLTLFGQSVKNYYVSKIVDNGTLYHLYPQELFQSSDGDDLAYDITYNSVNDSIALNITVVNDSVLKLKSIAIESENIKLKGELERLFVEPKGKQWLHRYSLNTQAEPLFSLYNLESNPQITLYTSDNEYIYSVKHSAWKKYAPIGNRIFEMIKIQRNN